MGVRILYEVGGIQGGGADSTGRHPTGPQLTAIDLWVAHNTMDKIFVCCLFNHC